MAAYARTLAKASGWSEDMAQRLELAAPMHDTGKIGIPDAILKAPRSLTIPEWQIMKQHSKIGCDILHKCDTAIFTMAAEIACSHHEKWDGSGYPDSLVGQNIPEAARIVALADVFDALTMTRPYKKAWSTTEAMAEISRGSGSHFEPRLAELFTDLQADIYQIKERWDNKE